MRRALPNATHIAFTGTPTERTENTYKGYIDKYTMRQAIDDGVTLEIIYEGFTHNAEVENNNWREYFNATTQKVNELQLQINETDKAIDRMVYDLYELTAEEIDIVENPIK